MKPILIAAAALSIGIAQTPRATDLLNLDVVVLDRKGVPVQDLRPAEFEVWINGFQIPIQTVTFVSPASPVESRTTVLLLDDITAHPTALPRIRETARRFVNRMSAGDRMAVVSFNGSTMIMTDDRALLLKTIDDYHQRGFPIQLDDAGVHVLKTVTELSRQLAEAPGGRKAIVAIGTGWLFDTPIPAFPVSRDLRPEWVDAMRATAAAHVSLYVIDPAGVGSRRASGGSSGFARETGGHAFMNTNDLNGAVDRVLRELATYYVLSVEDPPIGRKADLREVEIKVHRRDVTARARRGILPGR
jgi:VWFA-related protein